MTKDSLQPTWVKALGSAITDIDTDSKGNVWVGDITGTLMKFSGEGIASTPIQLDNPIYSVTVDKTTGEVYVGDSANNIYKYSASGTLQWGKNLGNTNKNSVPIVSTINFTEPDEKGNFDLTQKYYSKVELDNMLSKFGTVNSVNGNRADDKTGNVTLDLSNYYVFNGVLDDSSDLNKTTDTGWYIKHSADGTNSTFLVFKNDGNIMQVVIGYDGTVKQRAKTGATFSEWKVLTNNIQSINDIKPDKNGNVTLDLTGNIKSVNRIKPDADGNIQLGAGTTNSVKSINTDNKPDETGNVTVPTFSPNLLTGTSIKKRIIHPNTTNNSVNLWGNKTASTYGGVISNGAGAGQYGSQIIDNVPVVPGDVYSYSFDVSTKPNTVDMGLGTKYNNYTLWRKPKITINTVFYDANNNAISAIPHKYTLDSKNGYSAILVSESFVVPANAVSVGLCYNGLEDTAPNLVVGKDGFYAAIDSYSNSLDQMIDLPAMNLLKDISGTKIRVKLQANVTNYKKGSVFTVKTKDVNDRMFNLDNSKLDSNKELIKPIDAIDNNNLVTGNGFYSWEYTLNADDLVTKKAQTIVPVTNVVGNIDYTIKLVVLDNSDDKPDMEWTSALYNKNGVKYLDSAYNMLNFWYARLYANKAKTEVNLGSYNLKNDYIALAETKGKYSGSAHVDMLTSQGAYQLSLRKVNNKGTVIAEKLSELRPTVSKTSSEGTPITTVDINPFVKVDGLNNDTPADTESITLSLYVYGQTADISVSQAKLAQWKDNGKTPPDLTWLPSTEDTVGINSINDKLPDDNGNFLLHDIDHPDFSYAKNEVVDVDKCTETGIYHFMDSKVTSSMRKDALDGLPRTTDGTTMCGYMFVLRHDDFNREQVLMLNGGFELPDIVLATRSISGTNAWRPRFRRILNLDDYESLYKAIPSFQRPKFDKSNITLDLGTLVEPGIYNLDGTKLTDSKNNSCMNDIPDTAVSWDKGSKNSIYSGFLVITTQNNGAQVFQTLFTRSNLVDNYDYIISTRMIQPANKTTPVFKRLLNSYDYAKLNTINKPKLVSKNVELNTITDSGLYLVEANSTSSDLPHTSEGFDKTRQFYLFVPTQDKTNNGGSSGSTFQTILQVVGYKPDVTSYLQDKVYTWSRHVSSTGATEQGWFSKDVYADSMSNAILRLSDSLNDLGNRFKKVGSVQEAIEYGLESDSFLFCYW